MRPDPEMLPLIAQLRLLAAAGGAEALVLGAAVADKRSPRR